MTLEIQQEERRERFRKNDFYLRIILVLFGFIQGGIGWGLKEIYVTLRNHDQKIIIVETRLDKETNDSVSFRRTMEVRLDRIDDKLDRIISTGLLNHNPRRP